MVQLARPCDRHVVCPVIEGLFFPDPDSPYANLSSEKPDPVPNPYCIDHPSSPLCHNPPNPVPDGCRNCCPTGERLLNGKCVSIIPVPDGPCVGRNCPTDGNPIIEGDGNTGSVPFYNTAQSCTVECPDGSTFTHTIDAGRFMSIVSQVEADANAASYCEDEANSLLICIITDSLPSTCVGDYFVEQIEVQGGSPTPLGFPYFWNISGLPPGLDYNSTRGNIFGTPTAGGSYNVTVTVTDGVGNTRSKTLVLNVIEIISGPTLTSGAEQWTYGPVNLQATPTGGIWSVYSGSLPGGLSMNALGVISGTPDPGTGGQTFTFGVMYEIGDTVCTKNMSIKIWDYDDTNAGSVGGKPFDPPASAVLGPGLYQLNYYACFSPWSGANANFPFQWFATTEGINVSPFGNMPGFTAQNAIQGDAQNSVKNDMLGANPAVIFEVTTSLTITFTWPTMPGLNGITINPASIANLASCYEAHRIGQP